MVPVGNLKVCLYTTDQLDDGVISSGTLTQSRSILPSIGRSRVQLINLFGRQTPQSGCNLASKVTGIQSIHSRHFSFNRS